MALKIDRNSVDSLVHHYEGLLNRTHEALSLNKFLRRELMVDIKEAICAIQLNLELPVDPVSKKNVLCGQLLTNLRRQQFMSVKKIATMLSSIDHLNVAQFGHSRINAVTGKEEPVCKYRATDTLKEISDCVNFCRELIFRKKTTVSVFTLEAEVKVPRVLLVQRDVLTVLLEALIKEVVQNSQQDGIAIFVCWKGPE